MESVTIGNATLWLGDNREVMPLLTGIDAVITDPPYGCNKAEWDGNFPVEWYAPARDKAGMVAIITGSSGLKDSVRLVGEDFVDVISARNMNGMTRGPIGFGNWLAAVLAGKKPAQGPNAFDFCVSGDMPDHPSPKPYEYMHKLVARLTKKGDTVLDCFMGSGTTGVACMNLDRHFVGIEIERKFFDIACERIAAAQQQLKLAL